MARMKVRRPKVGDYVGVTEIGSENVGDHFTIGKKYKVVWVDGKDFRVDRCEIDKDCDCLDAGDSWFFCGDFKFVEPPQPRITKEERANAVPLPKKLDLHDVGHFFKIDMK